VDNSLQEHCLDFQWTNIVSTPVVADPFLSYPVYSNRVTQKCRLQVFVQGDLQQLEGKTVGQNKEYLSNRNFCLKYHIFIFIGNVI
jgi:hypothetical protein